MVFGSAPAIATRKVKWDKRYQKKYGITTTAAQDLPPTVVEQLERQSKRIYKALHLTGYARMDFRLRADGSLFVLEANANPNMSEGEDFADAARAAGVSYDELLAKILSLGLGYQAAWRIYES
jgi:D-alanine-D-alanine ligase